MTSPIPAPPARVVDQLSGEVAAGITPVVDVVAQAKLALQGITDEPWFQNGRNGVHTERGSCIATTHQQEPFHRRTADAEFIAAARTLVPELVAEVEAARIRVIDLQDSADEWWRRAQVAERELARLQEQQVRVDEQASRIQALEQALAHAVSERDSARAGVAGRGQK